MTKGEVPSWLADIETTLPEIQRVADACDEAYRLACFQALLSHALAVSNWSLRYSGDGRKGPGASIPDSRGSNSTESERFVQFIHTHDITPVQIGAIVDLNTGHIIARNLGPSVAERQRRIAAILGLWNASKTGDFDVPYDALIGQCKEFAAFDTANMSSNLRKAEEAGARVFINDGNNWKVTVPGQAYIARIVRELSALGQEGR